jgi:hypothetical protein
MHARFATSMGVVALLAGCGRSQLLAGDALPADAALPPSACFTRALVPVPLSAAELFAPGGAQPFAGRAVRVQVRWNRAACDLPGPLDVDERGGDGSDQLKVTAHIWRASPPCPTTESVTDSRVITLGDSSEILYTVFDTVADRNALEFKLPGPPDFSRCNMVQVPLGGTCANECECQGGTDGARCIPVTASAGACAIPCNEDVECPSSAPLCGGLGNPPGDAICAGAGEDCFCDPHRACPFGQGCSGLCGCRVTVDGAAVGRPCACQSDCPTGHLCTTGRCELPCMTVRDCPPGWDVCMGGLCASTI